MPIITETALEGTVVQDIEPLGANSYAISDARGKGRQGVRNAGWEPTGNIRIEMLCDAGTAVAIAPDLREHYCRDNALTLFLVDAVGWRSENPEAMARQSKEK